MTIGLEKTRELRRAYYAAVSFVDSELGRVISEVVTTMVVMVMVVMMVVVMVMVAVVMVVVVMVLMKMSQRSGSQVSSQKLEGEGAGTLGEHNHCGSW